MSELEYLQGLRFLQRSTVEDIQSSRLCAAELDHLILQQVQEQVDSAPAEGTDSSAAGLEKQIARLELQQRQLQSAVRDQVSTSLLRLGDLQRQYSAHLQTQLSSPQRQGSSGAAGIGGMRLLDLLSPALDPTSSGADEVLPLVVYCFTFQYTYKRQIYVCTCISSVDHWTAG